MRLVAISDTHGRHAELTLPEGDVLIHTGDFSRRGRVEELEDFNAWLGEQPFRHRIIIAGNHDWLFERDNAHARALITNAIYLEDSGCELAGLRFWGSPWTPVFFDWAFNLPRGEALAEVWRRAPAGVDVLLTHGPPKGILDRTTRGVAAGCEALRDELPRIAPRVHIFGHIHEAAGRHEQDGTVFLNASSLDARYQPAEAPVVIDLEPRPVTS